MMCCSGQQVSRGGFIRGISRALGLESFEKCGEQGINKWWNGWKFGM